MTTDPNRPTPQQHSTFSDLYDSIDVNRVELYGARRAKWIRRERKKLYLEARRVFGPQYVRGTSISQFDTCHYSWVCNNPPTGLRVDPDTGKIHVARTQSVDNSHD